MPRGAPRILIIDACVLIDFCDADASVLRIISRSVGAIHVPSTVLVEVDQLDESSARSLGIHVVEPPFAMFAAAANKRGGLSAADHLCLLMAIAEGWTCVTNDRALRNACTHEHVQTLWGLEMLGLAVRAGALPGDEAEQIVRRISEVNPMITQKVVLDFIRKFVPHS